MCVVHEVQEPGLRKLFHALRVREVHVAQPTPCFSPSVSSSARTAHPVAVGMASRGECHSRGWGDRVLVEPMGPAQAASSEREHPSGENRHEDKVEIQTPRPRAMRRSADEDDPGEGGGSARVRPSPGMTPPDVPPSRGLMGSQLSRPQNTFTKMRLPKNETGEGGSYGHEWPGRQPHQPPEHRARRTRTRRCD